MTNRIFLPTLILLFLGFGFLWVVKVPLSSERGEPSSRSFHPDESNHVSVIRYMAEHHVLPPYTFAYYESAQPPLYYVLASLIYGFVKPFAGERGALFMLRVMGCLFGAGILYTTFVTARLFVPEETARLAAMLVAGIPMFLSLSSAITNETFAAFAAANALAALAFGVYRGFHKARLVALAFWTAIGIGAKVTCLGLLPVALLAVMGEGVFRKRGKQKILLRLLIVLTTSVAISGWWYSRNFVLYGDPLRQAVEEQMWKDRIPGANVLIPTHQSNVPRYLLSVTLNGWISFWGRFDANSRALPTPFYVAIAIFEGVALFGLVHARVNQLQSTDNSRDLLFTCMGIFAVFVAAVYYRYNWNHYTPQGRFFFPLLLPFGIAFAGGLQQLSSRRLRNFLWACLPLLLIFINIFAILAFGTRPPVVP